MNTRFQQKQTKTDKKPALSSFVPFVSFCSSPLERQIDERVYRLYALTREEIKLVEESGK